MSRNQMRKNTKPRTITLYESILGTAIYDNDKVTGGIYLFNPPKTKYMKPSLSSLAEDYECFKGVNDINKPFAILLYEQIHKGKSHGIQGRVIQQEELDKIISNMKAIK